MAANSDFYSKLQTAIDRNDSLLCVGLDPQPAQIPARFRSTQGDPIQDALAWNRAIIEATAPYAAVYKPNIAFYEALGVLGAELLRATLDAIPDNIPVLLDAKRGDMGNTATAYAQAVFEQWQVDAVTLNPYLGRDSVDPFLAYPGKGLFVVCHTSNPGSTDFQEFEVNDWRSLDREANQPLYIHVARTVTRWGSNIGLVVGATFPEAIQATRVAAPNAWFLIPGIGAQGGDLEASVTAGIRDDKQGIVVNVSRSIAQADDPAAAAKTMRDSINAARSSKVYAMPAIPSSLQAEEQQLIDGLVELSALKFGDFTLASGQRSPIYIDLRLLVSAPNLLAQAADFYSAIVATLSADRLAGVPYAALPIATAVSLRTGMPMIYTRKEAKTHGLAKEVDGLWEPGERVIIIEDLITSGGSIIKTVEKLRGLGLIIEDVVVLIDRGQGGVAKLAEAGIRAHCVFTLPAMLDYLVAHGRMQRATADDVRAFLKGS
ncbi:MAG: orotidine-5'-phosphate decarboxylase [Caldilineaceae bacterium]|nr:orotidine-5'-phosphate decarboxylase [Caldilineaceae bacterium]